MKAADPADSGHRHGAAARLARLVDDIAERRREIAALQAEEIRLLSAAQAYAIDLMDAPSAHPDRPSDLPIRSIAAEIGTATVQSDRTVQARMSDAADLVAHFPSTMRALAAGRISRAHAGVIAEAGANLGLPEARAAYEAAVLPVAETETAGRLRPLARRIAHTVHPLPLDQRHRTARRERRIWVADREDGMAEFGLIAPAHLVHGAYDRITRLAATVIEARNTTPTTDLLETPSVTDSRRLDEVRADVACELLLTGHADTAESAATVGMGDTAVRAHVQVVVPVLALLGLSKEPADLAGYGPIDADTARRLASSAPGWDRLLTHPITGAVLAVDRYRPTSEQRRLLRARDEHCRFPGCRQPPSRCDLDHTRAHAHDGPTDVRNLAHLCRRHHVLKHHSAWRVRQRPDGTLHWTSPTGREYDDRPARTLVFERDPAPAPF